MKITRVDSQLVRLPLGRPVALPASQDPRAATHIDVLIVQIQTDAKPTGLGFSYTLGGGGRALHSLFTELIEPMLLGENPLRTEWLYLRALAELEGLGQSGLAARAYAAADFALWDLKGQAAQMPVYQLLGGYRTKLKAIVADCATPALGAKAAAKECKAMLDRGAAGVLVEIGTQDPDVDIERVQQLRQAIPEGAWFEVSAAGRYDFSTARFLGRMFEEELPVDSFVDPLRPDDLRGLSRLSETLELSLAVGALYDRVDDFLRTLETIPVDAVRIDAVRLGGLTPARKVALAAELKQSAICPVRLPVFGAHLACGVVYGRVMEYVDWFEKLFRGGPQFQDGQFVVGAEPGFGITLDEAFAAKHQLG
ncbi:MAG: mandelate racemase/muconate lactonizing enzyme family protein [Gemmataceae bacterium]